jgi:hypothetical protein
VRPKAAPPIPISSLLPHRVSLRPGHRPWVMCPWCDKNFPLTRSMLPAHRDFDGEDRCPGSAQKFAIDETPTAWKARLAEAVTDAGTRRGSRTVRDPYLPVPTPLHRIAAAR